MTNKKHYPLIRTIYLYLFALLGLGLLTIGGLGFVDMGLRAFIFTATDERQRIIHQQPAMPWIRGVDIELIERKIEDEEKVYLTQEQKADIERWLAHFRNWEEREKEIDPVTARRHEDAARNLAMILIGLPLYLYHWWIIKKEIKKKEEEEQ